MELGRNTQTGFGIVDAQSVRNADTAAPDGWRDFLRLGDRLRVALGGTKYFVSQKISRPRCLKRERSSGKTEYDHALLGATLVAPGHNCVLPRRACRLRPRSVEDRKRRLPCAE